MQLNKIAAWIFIVGIALSLFIGLWQAYDLQSGTTTILSTENGTWIAWILALLGVITGLLAVTGAGSIQKDEIQMFLLAGISLLVMYGVFSSVGLMLKPWLGPLLAGLSFPLAIFVAPAVGIIAVKTIWDIGKN